MSEGMAIDLVEEINTSKEDKYYAEEIRTEEKTDDDNRDYQGSSDSIPVFPSFESIFKCPRKSFHII